MDNVLPKEYLILGCKFLTDSKYSSVKVLKKGLFDIQHYCICNPWFKLSKDDVLTDKDIAEIERAVFWLNPSTSEYFKNTSYGYQDGLVELITYIQVKLVLAGQLDLFNNSYADVIDFTKPVYNLASIIHDFSIAYNIPTYIDLITSPLIIALSKIEWSEDKVNKALNKAGLL